MSATVHKVPEDVKKRAKIDAETYRKWYAESVDDTEGFWKKHGKRIDWFTPYTKVKNTDFTGDVSIKWFEDGVTNVSYNCIDRHLESAATRPPSSGRATSLPTTRNSPSGNCMKPSAGWRT